MAFQTPITINAALERIQKHEYALPAIQREFVWSTDQVCTLFDSLMQGYPIGPFLFWKVEGSRRRDLVVYDLIREYHELKAPHCPRLDLPRSQPFTAVLDGQQRLTAFNIGLRGSHAEKLPRKWRNNPDAYPQKRLYLNLAARAEESELEMEYAFRFLTPQEARDAVPLRVHWFPVNNVLDMEPGPGVFDYIQQAGLADHPDAFHTLHRLHHVIHEERTINFYEEEAQDLDRVLNIFVRVNSAGTVLSYSDILLSIATAQWRDLDARDAIHGLVDDLNEMGQGFAFNKDIVLKAGLVLVDIGDIRFKVVNFSEKNMRTLESKWDEVSSSLRLAARILADFGFSERNLKADSVLIPIAYYVRRLGLDSTYLTASRHQEDRRNLRRWVIRSLVKSGVWGSGLDTLLTALRTAIRQDGSDGFPVPVIEREMTRLGKSLRFQDDEIEDLVETPYGNKNIFPILTLLYPGVNTRNEFHEDHVFPKKWMTRSRLRRAGVDDSLTDEYRDRMNSLPNLQLLEGPVNTQKADRLPAEWARLQYPDEQARNMYLSSHDMHDLPGDMTGFLSFYEARRDRMAARLRELLDVGEVGTTRIGARRPRKKKERGVE